MSRNRYTNKNDSAFTKQGPNFYGLTKREYFVAAALQGMMAAQSNLDFTEPHPNMVKQCINVADAIIDEMNKEKDDE